ncbi:MAG TPA: polysaccharide deacetylase family protein [Sedimentisphaerales bacterium]|jgi:peptidoglycan/xylan/chitin deacetylase (PgdA/CDA1 family)|nr:polysaccharide deacetylase family protein [Sedimentisphaerales bacterium]HNU28971.1 polysaccharide deacetylase family protein [Sedimentisphaerales bacterium]
MNRVSRRELMGTALGVAVLAGTSQGRAAESPSPKTGTRYIAAYDTESPACLQACRKIVEVHKRLAMPATFFIVGRTLEANAAEYKTLFADPLFEVASHTWSHKLLRDNAMCGRAVSAQEKREEIFKAKELIEQVFERPCVGLRSAVGFDNGLKGATDVLELVRAAGFQYVSTLLWGPDCSMPALIETPFHYGADGFADVWELPGHGWHENLLKNHNRWGAKRLTLWPSPMPEAIPSQFVKTPEDEARINRVFLDKAREEGKPHVSLIWHPWSLHSFDPEMKMLELTFAHARAVGLIPSTYTDLYRQIAG